MNLEEMEIPRKAEPFSREMYEELEQRVAAFQSLLQLHDQEVQELSGKLSQAETEKAQMMAQIEDRGEETKTLKEEMGK